MDSSVHVWFSYVIQCYRDMSREVVYPPTSQRAGQCLVMEVNHKRVTNHQEFTRQGWNHIPNNVHAGGVCLTCEPTFRWNSLGQGLRRARTIISFCIVLCVLLKVGLLSRGGIQVNDLRWSRTHLMHCIVSYCIILAVKCGGPTLQGRRLG